MTPSAPEGTAGWATSAVHSDSDKGRNSHVRSALAPGAMKQSPRPALIAGILAAAGCSQDPRSPAPSIPIRSSVQSAAGGANTENTTQLPTQLLGHVPAAFVQNLGQWQHASNFVAHFGAMTVLLEDRGWWLSVAPDAKRPVDRRTREAPAEPQTVRGAALRMTFCGNGEPSLAAEDRLSGVHNYFLGRDPARWRTDVPRFGTVVYRGLNPGVDLRAYGKDGHFEYDLVLAPGADLAGVEVRVEGSDPLRIDTDGALPRQGRRAKT